MYDRVVKNSNVVINLVGPRLKVKDRDEFEYINIKIAKRIAEACKRNDKIVRLIHFSSAGAKADAESQDFATKYIGEQEVLDIFPNATIFRPTVIYGSNDYYVQTWRTFQEFWFNKVVVTDDCTAQKQPILVHDVA
jgi:NADH dehydrogenase (ubiquinone) 1 alpha subcomplex subunit 9